MWERRLKKIFFRLWGDEEEGLYVKAFTFVFDMVLIGTNEDELIGEAHFFDRFFSFLSSFSKEVQTYIFWGEYEGHGCKFR